MGLLTERGARTSHAAVVARGMGKCCITGCGSLQIDYAHREFTVNVAGRGAVVVREGDVLSIDGTTGEVMLGALTVAAAFIGKVGAQTGK